MAKKSIHRYGTQRKSPKEVPASTFKNSCLQLIDRVGQTREEIVVTKYGRPVAKLVAFDEGKATAAHSAASPSAIPTNRGVSVRSAQYGRKS